MNDCNARIKISLKEGEFELSGSETFVSSQIDNFKELIIDSLQKLQTTNTTSSKTIRNSDSDSNNSESNSQNPDREELKTANNFPRVFHVENDVIKIIKRAPGNNNAQKSVSTALIYLWAKNSLGISEVAYPEIRDLCKDQGCLDPTNFAAHMKSAKEEIVLDGNGRFTKCKLTLPGKERALSIIEELNK